MNTGDTVGAVFWGLVLLMGLFVLVTLFCNWLAWRKLPAADPAIGLVLVSFGGTRVKVVASVRSEVDDRPLCWRAVDDGGRPRGIPLNGAGWRRER